jgi:kynurenine formamidase
MTSAADLALVTGARVIDLSHPFENGMPQSPNHPPFRMSLERRHGDVVREDGASAANEIIITGGHVGTHVDAIAHVSQDGLLFGGEQAAGAQTNRGFDHLGIDEFAPYFGRCFFLDVAAVHGVDCLDPGYEVTAADLQRAYALTAPEIRAGEVILIGTGWSRQWSDPGVFNGQQEGTPGPGVEAANWLLQFKPRAVGAETIAFEQIPRGRGHAVLPVHRMMLVESGVNIIETINMRDLLGTGVTEFLLVLNPLRIVGATGSPVRPLAIVT